MIGETSIPEKETEVIKVTLTEIEVAIESLDTIKDIFMKASKINSLMSRTTGGMESAKEAAEAMDEIMGTAIKSMKFLYGMLKMNGLKEISGSIEKKSDKWANEAVEELEKHEN